MMFSLKSLIGSAVLSALLFVFVYSRFGDSAYLPVTIISILVILGIAIYIWIRFG